MYMWLLGKRSKPHTNELTRNFLCLDILTSDDESILATSDAHVDLMLVSDEPQMVLPPCVVRLHVMLVSDLFQWL